jgi:hypothetical protein
MYQRKEAKISSQKQSKVKTKENAIHSELLPQNP